MKRLLLVLFLLLNFSSGSAQKLDSLWAQLDSSGTHSDTLKIRIKRCADQMVKALLEKDFETFIRYMDKKTVNDLGGKEKVIAKLKENDLEIDSVKMDLPSDTIQFNNKIQCTIDQIIHMKVEQGVLEVKSTSIGISDDGGINWYFLSTTGGSFEVLKARYPYLSDRLIIPPKSEPVLIK